MLGDATLALVVDLDREAVTPRSEVSDVAPSEILEGEHERENYNSVGRHQRNDCPRW